MKLAQIVCTYPPYQGGIGNSAHLFAQSIDCVTFTPGAETIIKEKIIRLKPILKSGNGAILIQLFKHLKPFDTIYFHYPFFGSTWIVWIYKILNPNTKLIIQYHMETKGLSSINKLLSIPEKLIEKAFFKQATTIIASSLDYLEHTEIKKYLKLWPEKFKALPFGIDTKKFYPQENKQNKIPQLIFIANLDSAHYFKGLDILITTLKTIELPYKLEIIGNGDMKPYYQTLAKDNPKIEFINTNDLPKTLREKDILILPSINSHEAFGIVLLEAMASGVAILASRLPGVRTVFNDHEQGLYINPNDPKDLQAKLIELLSNPEKTQAMGQKGRELAIEKYDHIKITEELKSLL